MNHFLSKASVGAVPAAEASYSFPDLQRRLDVDELPQAAVIAVRVYFLLLVLLIVFNIYQKHCRCGRDAHKKEKLKELEVKLKKDMSGISSSNAIASDYRLPFAPPNILAHTCSSYLKSRVLLESDPSRMMSCCSTFLESLSIFFFGFGIIMLIYTFTKWEEGAFAIPFMCVVFFGPGVAFYIEKSKEWQYWDPSGTNKILGEFLDGRLKAIVVSSRLRELEPRDKTENGDSVDRTTARWFPSAFSSLQRAGYASVPSWALYAAAVEHISDDDFSKVHALWFDTILPRAASTFVRFTNGLDDTRQRAHARLRKQALGAVTGGIGDAINVANDIREMKQMVEDIQATVEDIKETKQVVQNASSVKKEDVHHGLGHDFVPRDGFHPIPRKWFQTMSFSLLGMFGFQSIGFYNVPHENAVLGGSILLLFPAVLIPFGYWLSRKRSASHNAVEDMIDIEILSRKTMEAKISQLMEAKMPSISREDMELIEATNGLRQVLMDNFYAALAIHTSAECMTYRLDSYGHDAPMLFPRDRSFNV